MDHIIDSLKSTTFGGRRFTRKQLVTIQKTVNTFSALSRRELAHTICEHLQWKTPKGENRIQTCLGALESMEELDLFSLPKKKKTKQKTQQKKIIWTEQSDSQPLISDSLAQLMPVSLQLVKEKESVALWNEMVDRHHYLGYKRPIGPHLRYFILDDQGRKLGCLMFSYPVKSLACRDEWIGWQDLKYKKHLNLVINNNRFLIFPWVKVKCLASKALSMAAQQLAADWQAQHGYQPVLLETFVDHSLFDATCYRAANWHYIGETEKRVNKKRELIKTAKSVYIYPLVNNAKSILINGASIKKRKTFHPPGTLSSSDPFVQLWQNIITTVVDVARDFDQQWQKRKRVLNTLLIMLFIFRLVFSKNNQGYAITITELWEQCRAMGIALPQATPVAPSAFCNARAKLDEHIFKTLHQEIIHQYDAPRTDTGVEFLWKSHRLFAVDGSKLNLPRHLLKDGYRTPSDNAHYPQGLLSCLYQLKSKIPMDFELSAHSDERKLALGHLSVLSKNDVVVYDRGYFSYAMLFEHQVRAIHPIFRIKTKASKVVDQFIVSDEVDSIVEIIATASGQKNLQEKHPEAQCQAIKLRLVKYTIAGTTYILGTTLLDQQKYSILELSDVYHSRWGVEELYKISKQLIKVEEFHAQSERGVKQELYAHFILITLTRIFSNHSDDGFQSEKSEHKKQAFRANFKNGLFIVARNIESLFLKQAEFLSESIRYIVSSISSCRQRIRPNRSYARCSKKPIGKWKAPKPAKLKPVEVHVGAT